MPRHSTFPRGAAALIALMGVTVFSLMVLTSVSTLAHHAYEITLADTAGERTFYAAEAGLNEGLYHLASNPAAASFSMNHDGVPVSVAITPNGFKRIVTATAQDQTGKVRVAEVQASTTVFAGGFTYGAQTDVGGVTMSSSDSTINGDIYSNGDVSGSGVVNGSVTVADNSTLDQQDASRVVAADEFSFGQVAAIAKGAQQFTAGTTGTLNHFAVLLRAQGNPNPTALAWQVRNDNADKPATTTLASGLFGSLDAHSTLTWVYVHVPTPVSVTAGTKYWLVVDPVVNATNYWAWGKDVTGGAGAYAGGTAVSWNSTTSTWSTVAGADLNFKTWLGTAYTSLSNVTVLGNASADNISASKVCGDASYFTITSTAQSFISTPTNPPCALPLTPGTGTTSDILPPRKALPIGSADIVTWQDEIQAVCGSGCIGSNYSVSTNLNPSASAVSTAGDSLTIDTTYYYRIAAVVGGVETVTSKEVSATIPHNGSKRSIQLTWNLIGSSTYRVYRSTTAGVYSSPALLASLSSNSYTDTGNTAVSSGTTTCPDTCLGWQKITGSLTVENGAKLTLTGNVWVTGDITVAPNAIVKVDSNLSPKSPVLLTNQKVDASNNVTLCGSGCVSGITAAVSNGGSLATNTKYYYVVTALVGGNEMGESAEVSDTTTNSKRTITLNWSVVPGATAYRVYRTTSSGIYNSLVYSPVTNSFIDDGSALLTASSPVTNFLLVVSSETNTSVACPYTGSGTQPSIQAANNSNSVIFAAPFGQLDVKKGSINAGASRSLCLETQAVVNFVSSISSLFVPSPVTQPIASVPNTWQEK